MATFPRTSGTAKLATIPLANTLDFHVATTDWLKFTNQFVNEIATFYTYEYTKHTADPITTQANFFMSLNLDELMLNTDQRGTIEAKVFEDSFVGYQLTKLDTLLEENEIWIKSDDGLPERRSDGTALSSFHAFNLTTGKDKWYGFTADVNELVKENINKVNEKYGTGSMGFEFINYWYEKFLTSHKKVREEYNKLLEEFNVDPDNDIFGQLSDSIGCIVRTIETTEPRDLPISLIRKFPDEEDMPPVSTLPQTLSDKLEINTLRFDSEITEKTNNLFRSNISNVIESLGAPNVSHQQNIMSDFLHKPRITKLTQKLNGQIAQTLGKTYSLLFYIRNAENKQKAASPIIEAVVEQNLMQIDMLKNRIQTINKAYGNSALSGRPISSPGSD